MRQVGGVLIRQNSERRTTPEGRLQRPTPDERRDEMRCVIFYSCVFFAVHFTNSYSGVQLCISYIFPS